MRIRYLYKNLKRNSEFCLMESLTNNALIIDGSLYEGGGQVSFFA